MRPHVKVLPGKSTIFHLFPEVTVSVREVRMVVRTRNVQTTESGTPPHVNDVTTFQFLDVTVSLFEDSFCAPRSLVGCTSILQRRE